MDFRLVDVAYFRPSPDWDFSEPQKHEWHELIYVEKGSYTAISGANRQTLGRGEFVMYPAATTHNPSASLDRTVTLYMLQWRSENPSTTPDGLVHGRDLDARLLDLLAWMWQLSLDRSAPGRPELLTSLACAIATHALDLVRPHPQQQSPAEAAIRRACAYIEANIARNVCLADIAHFMQKSPSQTIRVFKAHLGTTPMKHLQQVRVRQAVRLLRSSRDSFQQIVESTGLGSTAYASRLIKAATGRTPRAIRES